MKTATGLIILTVIIAILATTVSFRSETEKDNFNKPINPENSPNLEYVKRKLYNIENFKKTIKNATVVEKSINQAVDLLEIKIKAPIAACYITVIDLIHPNVEVVLTEKKGKKYLTSEFATKNECIVAINGEAGVSPKQGCIFGQWTGNWIVKGNPILLTDTKRRPFMSFDIKNKAKYSRENIVDTLLTPEKYNTIWGRYDLIIDGETYNTKLYRPRGKEKYSRTIMGINAEGNALYLMVIDGRNKYHSLGMLLTDAANILKSLGVHNAMACDQGGSSCMYVNDKIINKPCDGRERIVYTHFGVKMNN